MASYISSNANRFYTGLETAYGVVPAISASNRIPALKLTVQQQLEATQRKDKTDLLNHTADGGACLWSIVSVGPRHGANSLWRGDTKLG